MIKSKIKYGDDGLPLDDVRDFIEAYEEILDALVYVSAKLIQLRNEIQNNRNLK